MYTYTYIHNMTDETLERASLLEHNIYRANY